MGYIRCAVKNSFKSLTTYRTFTVVAIISSVFGLLIQIAIWKALYNGQNVVHTESNQIYLSDMIQYAVFSMLISILINNSATSNIEKRISSGQVSIDFIRPVGFALQITCSEIANVLFNFLFTFIPMGIISILIVGIKVFKISHVGWFILTLVNSIVLFYLINYMIGLLSIWFITIWPLNQVLDGVIKLISGALIPLWFLPKTIYTIASFLPFRLIYYFPITICLGKTDTHEMFEGIAIQYIWILILFVICVVIWNRGSKKLTVQGG